MAHKRRDAKYCSRECKCKSAKRRAAAEGRIRSNQDRYIRERERRLASARQYYWDKHEDNLKRAAVWRKNNPAKRLASNQNRRARKYENPDYVDVSDRDWEDILRINMNRCAYCHASDKKLVRDHIVPLSKGGRHAPANLIPACVTCNSSKNAMFLSEWKHRGRAPKTAFIR